MQTFAQSNRNEQLRALSLVESQLADNGSQRHDSDAAGRWITVALGLHARTDEPLDARQLDVVWLASKLVVVDHVPLSVDVTKRMATAEDLLAHHSGSPLRAFARWFEIYGPLTPAR